MTRLLTAVLAFAAIMVLPDPDSLDEAVGTPAIPFELPDTGVVVRRVFEGSGQEFWRSGVSPDGRYLSIPRGHQGLDILDFLTGRQRTIDSEGSAYMSTFSPDGTQIAYATWEVDLEDIYQIRVIGVDGSGDRLLWRGAREEGPGVPPVDVEGWPAVSGWTSDGKAVLAVIYGEGLPWLVEVALFPLDGSPRRVLYRPAPGIKVGFTALSPDGRFLAFGESLAVATPEQPTPDHDVFVLELDGGGRPVAVAPSPVPDQLVGWTEDGHVLLASKRGLTEGVWSVELRNGKPAGEPTLVKGDLWGMEPIGMAGNTVFYGVATQHRQVHSVGLSLAGRRLAGPLTPVEPDMRPSDNPVWSPDGRHLAYRAVDTDRSVDREMVVIRTASGQETQKIDVDHVTSGTSGGLAWPNGGELYLTGKILAERGDRGWAALDLSTGKARTLFTSSDVPDCGDYPEFHPDGGAFCTRRYYDEGLFERTELLELDLTSGTTRVVWVGHEKNGTFRYPSLSPDGSRFAFFDWRIDPDAPGVIKSNLNVLSAQGGNPIAVLSFDRIQGRIPQCRGRSKALWTPDGTQLLIVIPAVLDEGETPGPEACPLYLVPASGGDPVRIGALPEHFDWALSPDGTRLAVTAGEPRGEIWVLEDAGR